MIGRGIYANSGQEELKKEPFWDFDTRLVKEQMKGNTLSVKEERHRRYVEWRKAKGIWGLNLKTCA